MCTSSRIQLSVWRIIMYVTLRLYIFKVSCEADERVPEKKLTLYIINSYFYNMDWTPYINILFVFLGHLWIMIQMNKGKAKGLFVLFRISSFAFPTLFPRCPFPFNFTPRFSWKNYFPYGLYNPPFNRNIHKRTLNIHL